MENPKCQFCEKEVTKRNFDKEKEVYKIECPVCSKYCISWEAWREELSVTNDDKILFSGYLFNRPADEKKIVITTDFLAEISEKIAPFKGLTVPDKINNIVLSMGDESKFIGEGIPWDAKFIYSHFYCKNEVEFRCILDYLKEKKIIELSSMQNDSPTALLTIDGWSKYEELKQTNINSKQAFIAMNFASEFDEINKVIEGVCDDCGFKGARVDKKEHNEKICDRII